MKKDIHNYDDIINLPRHISTKHPQMPVSKRAAQFSPFAALTGHKESILEKARLTDEKKELDENQKELLDRKLKYLLLNNNLVVKITYFLPDIKKSGGSYVTITDKIKKIDEYDKIVLLTNGMKIKISDIYTIDF